MKAPTVSLILFSLRLITASEGQARIGEIGIAVDNAGGDLYERGAMSGVDADSEAMGAIRAGRRGASESEEMGAIRTVARTVDLLQEQNELLAARVDELERLAFDGEGNPLEEQEQSLLELFGEGARDFLVHRLTPRTDPQCRWHYAKARCVPKCACVFAPKLGDYTPGRACRLLAADRVDPSCDPRSIEDEEGVFVKLSGFVHDSLVDLGRFLDEAAPRTDPMCRFALDKVRCEPHELCGFRYRFGDFSPGRACRRLSDGELAARAAAAIVVDRGGLDRADEELGPDGPEEAAIPV